MTPEVIIATNTVEYGLAWTGDACRVARKNGEGWDDIADLPLPVAAIISGFASGRSMAPEDGWFTVAPGHHMWNYPEPTSG